MDNNTKIYQCTMCQNTSYTKDKIRVSGVLSRFFDVQNKQFTTISCTKCGHTQFFKNTSSMGGNIIDFFFGG